jgi:2,4'-dihydroxyacetophenone dioxygenase
MPITGFSTFTDGVDASKRRRHDFIVNVDLDDEKLWVPYVENVWFQPCYFNIGGAGSRMC